jgi:hypothetical protein
MPKHVSPRRTVGYCSLSDSIKTGLAKDGTWKGPTEDVTAAAVEAIIHYVCNDITRGGSRSMSFGPGNAYRITIQRIDDEEYEKESANA